MSAKTTGNDVSRRLVGVVRDIRTRRGWSAAELARRVTDAGFPVTREVLTNTETRSQYVTVDLLVGLAAAFNMKPSELLESDFCRQCGGEPPVGFECTICGAGRRG